MGKGKGFFTPTLLVLFASISPETASTEEAIQNLGPYEVIVQKDPFDPSRKAPEIGETVIVISAGDEVKKRYHLYGTVISGTTRVAFLQSSDEKQAGPQMPKRPAGPQARPQEDRIRPVTVGDRVDGWMVEDISDKNVTLVSGDERIQISLFDSEKPERKATAPVGLQTPQVRPATSPVPEKTPALHGAPDRPPAGETIPPKSPKALPPGEGPPVPPATAGPAVPSSFSGNASSSPNPFPRILKKLPGGTP